MVDRLVQTALALGQIEADHAALQLAQILGDLFPQLVQLVRVVQIGQADLRRFGVGDELVFLQQL